MPSWNETPGSLLALKKRCVGGRRSAVEGGSLLWAVGSRRLAVGSVCSGWLACGGRLGESSLDAERSRPKRQNVAVGDLLSESSVGWKQDE